MSASQKATVDLLWDEIFAIHGERSCKSVARLSMGERICLIRNASGQAARKYNVNISAKTVESVHRDLEGFAQFLNGNNA